MEKYHTGRPLIQMREYGRYMQDFVRHTSQIKDKELRQAYIEKVINMFVEMHPAQVKSMEDYRLKIWSHVLQMADEPLDVVVPDNVPQHQPDQRPDRVPYPKNRISLRHYGKHIHTLIAKAIEMDNLDKRREFVEVIAAYMKMSYQTYARMDISDEIIARDLLSLSNGELSVGEESDLNYLSQSQPINPLPSAKGKNNRQRTNSRQKQQSNTAPKTRPANNNHNSYDKPPRHTNNNTPNGNNKYRNRK